jgi:predicted flavoprotein YhiN
MNDYYSAAREILKMDRNSAAVELEKFHQQSIEQAAELAAELIRAGREAGTPMDQVEAEVRKLKISGRQLAHDRMFLRRAEAILSVLRGRKAIIVSKKELDDAFANGDGVDVESINRTTFEVKNHEGKYEGR